MRQTKPRKEKQAPFLERALLWSDIWVRVPDELAKFIKEESKGYATQAEYLRNVFFELQRNGVTYSSKHREENGPTTNTDPPT